MLFGTKENCRTESLLFEVVDLESPYHALLGRPALAKFMASTHIPNLKMKLPGPNGVITISGDYRKSLECASAGSRMAESMVIAAEKKRIYEVAPLAQSAKQELSAPRRRGRARASEAAPSAGPARWALSAQRRLARQGLWAQGARLATSVRAKPGGRRGGAPHRMVPLPPPRSTRVMASAMGTKLDAETMVRTRER